MLKVFTERKLLISKDCLHFYFTNKITYSRSPVI